MTPIKQPRPVSLLPAQLVIASALWLVLLLVPRAFAGYDIGAPTTGAFGKIGAFMQEVVDFIDGPTALFFTVVSIVVGAILYALSPKSGAMGTIVRIVIAAIVALNVATWVVAFKNGG